MRGLEAVLRGIDAAFEKWRSRKVKTQMVNSLAFCSQAVLTEDGGEAMAVARVVSHLEKLEGRPREAGLRLLAALDEVLRQP